MNNEVEKRSFGGSVSYAGNKLVGYAAVWDSPAQINERGKTFTEVVRRGAFRKALDSRADIKGTLNHGEKFLGRTGSGTMRLSEDSHGLRYEIDLPAYAADVKEMVARGDLSGSSFMFQTRQGGDRWDGDTRELLDLWLMECGPVHDPAYRATSAALRSQIPIMKMKLELRSRE